MVLAVFYRNTVLQYSLGVSEELIAMLSVEACGSISLPMLRRVQFYSAMEHISSIAGPSFM
jgi:hypothetical protein